MIFFSLIKFCTCSFAHIQNYIKKKKKKKARSLKHVTSLQVPQIKVPKSQTNSRAVTLPRKYLHT